MIKHEKGVEATKDKASLEHICEIMKTTPSWARGLILDVDGFQCEYYRK